MSHSCAKPSAVPAEPPEAIALTGYVEPARGAGYVRLYLDTTMRSYIDVLEGDVRHREHAGRDGFTPRPKTTLWIRRDASLEYTTANG